MCDSVIVSRAGGQAVTRHAAATRRHHVRYNNVCKLLTFSLPMSVLRPGESECSGTPSRAVPLLL